MPSISMRNPSVGSVWRTHRVRTLAPFTAKSSRPTPWKETEPRSSSGRIGKYGGLHHVTEHDVERPRFLLRPVDVDGAAAGGHRREERQALDVVPVEVREQDARVVPVEPAVGGELLAVVAQAGAEVEDQRVVALARDLDARRVTAIAIELVAVTRSRSANPPERDMRRGRHRSTIPRQPDRNPQRRIR